MKKKILLLSILCLSLVCLTSCSIPTDANGNVVPITLNTPFADMFETGFLDAILVYPIAQAINWSAQYVGVFWAIVFVTVVINGIILAFTFKSNVQMQKMQAIQPQLEKIQRKYEGRDDQQSKMKMSAEMQKLYKDNDISPFGSIIPTFIQLPIILAVWTAVRRSDAVLNGTFLGVSLDITPLESFQAVFAGNVETAYIIIIVVYLLAVAGQILSSKLAQWLQERRNKKLCEKQHRTYHKPSNQMNTMMYVMLAFSAFIFIQWSSAVSLYYFIYSVINILKTLFIDWYTNKENAKDDKKVEVIK